MASGAAVSRSMMAPGPPVTASEWRTTSPSLARSTPAASASRLASPTAAKAGEVIRLRAILAWVPAPTGPRCATSPAQQPNGPRQAVDRLIGAADHHGQGAVVSAHRPAADRRVDDRDAVGLGPAGELDRGLGVMVECTATTVPGVAAEAMPSSPATDLTHLRVVGTMTEMTVAWRATSAGDVAARAPLATKGSVASGRTSNTVSPSGQSSSRFAIGAPMLPSPMKPTPIASAPDGWASLTIGTPVRRRR